MKGEITKAQTAGELPGAGEQRAGASDDVREQERVAFTEMAGGAKEKIMRGAGHHGGAEEQTNPPANEREGGGGLRHGGGCGARGNGSEAGHVSLFVNTWMAWGLFRGGCRRHEWGEIQEWS